MKINRFIVWWLCFVAWPVLAQSQTDFARQAGKWREEQLASLEPKVMLHTGSSRARSSATRVLVLGDSLSVSAFGESLGSYLGARFGRSNVYMFAAGGSSPQSWLQSEPEYVTKCGYRQQTGDGTLLIDYRNGHRPRPVQIPKVETLIKRYRPTLVIVQLGTNWMDGLVSRSSDDEYARYVSVTERFVQVLRNYAGGDRQIIWITPPDSAKFSGRVQRTVEGIIRDAARKYTFETIGSRSMTHYVTGKTGGDGVHYNSEASEAWARQVERELDRKLK